MYSFLAFSKEMVKYHFQKTKNPLYLNIVRKKVPKKVIYHPFCLGKSLI
jgi:hypothetical protein